ncbi:MAG TPA: DUF3618 domain-containing protein [Chloroflexota bacterium]|nr:DUF3618 domain-containing protein [Chloroflexota bacterium]
MIARDGRDRGGVVPTPVGGGNAVTVPERSEESRRNEIQLEMARTRADLGKTMDALQERLDPQRVKEQVANSIREATIGKVEEAMSKVEQTARDTSYSFVDTIRHNPIPAALVGVGLAWLFFNGPEGNGHSNQSYPRYQTNGYPGNGPTYGGYQPSSGPALDPGQIKDTAQQLATQAGSQVQRLGQQAQNIGNQAKDQIGTLGDQVQDTVQQVGSQARNQVDNLSSQAQQQVTEFQSDVQDRVQSFGSDVQQQANRLSYSFERAMRDNPLSVAAVALALGAAVGLAAPDVPHEDELIGDTRRQVKEKAQEAAHQALENVQKIADQVQTTAAEPDKPL